MGRPFCNRVRRNARPSKSASITDPSRLLTHRSLPAGLWPRQSANDPRYGPFVRHCWRSQAGHRPRCGPHCRRYRSDPQLAYSRPMTDPSGECVSCSADRSAGEFRAERVSELSSRISAVSSREWVDRRDRKTTPTGVRDRYSRGSLWHSNTWRRQHRGVQRSTGSFLARGNGPPYPQDARHAQLSDSTNATVKPAAVASLRVFRPDCDHTAHGGPPTSKGPPRWAQDA
jgi:hypothetical protein